MDYVLLFFIVWYALQKWEWLAMSGLLFPMRRVYGNE